MRKFFPTKSTFLSKQFLAAFVKREEKSLLGPRKIKYKMYSKTKPHLDARAWTRSPNIHLSTRTHYCGRKKPKRNKNTHISLSLSLSLSLSFSHI
jgi:hypothetical protein